MHRRNRFLSSFPEKSNVLVFLRAFREPEYSVFLIHDGAITSRWDLRGIPGEGEIRMENTVQPDSDWIPNCLIELYADKLFIPMPDGTDRNAMMREGVQRFLVMP